MEHLPDPAEPAAEPSPEAPASGRLKLITAAAIPLVVITAGLVHNFGAIAVGLTLAALAAAAVIIVLARQMIRMLPRRRRHRPPPRPDRRPAVRRRERASAPRRETRPALRRESRAGQRREGRAYLAASGRPRLLPPWKARSRRNASASSKKTQSAKSDDTNPGKPRRMWRRKHASDSPAPDPASEPGPKAGPRKKATPSPGPPVTPGGQTGNSAPLKGQPPSMSPPVEAVTEAIHDHIGAWEPENATDILGFLDALPDVSDAHATALTAVADRLADSTPTSPLVLDHLRELAGTFAGHAEAVREVAEIFRRDHEAELRRLEDPRAGEEMFDVTQNL
ncbi:MAG TPA: hypothetical protein VFQ44_01670 [Streptosporangiaceae bacterium]|nr:hypothetical protein [Streptosporangiaceae bacterium]